MIVVEQNVDRTMAKHESGSGAPIGAAEVSMKHVNVVPNGIDHEVGAMASNGVMSAVPRTMRLEEGIRPGKRGVLRSIDAAPPLIYVHGLDGRIIFVNKFATDYCGLTLETYKRMIFFRDCFILTMLNGCGR